jgi:hypothetical protein
VAVAAVLVLQVAAVQVALGLQLHFLLVQVLP